MIFRTGDRWTMIYSEGLANQHLAFATSADLLAWELGGPVDLPRQKWMARKYGAPFVWREADQWLMMLMGESPTGKTTFGLLTSPDGQRWTLLPEAP
jgi:sucrose-6-phosphate hydrolase SacC (GH32 family)